MFEQLKYEMFAHVSGATVDGLTHWGFTFVFWIIAIFIMFVGVSRNENYKAKMGSIFVFSIMTYLYLYLIRVFTYPLGMLYPAIFIPFFIIFILLFKTFKYFKYYFALFLAVPLTVIIIDNIQVKEFSSECVKYKSEGVYNPIYLPRRYFIEKNGKLKFDRRNIADVASLKTKTLDKNKVYVLSGCNKVDIEAIESVKMNGYVALCSDYSDIPNFEGSNFYTVYRSLSVVGGG